MYFISIRPRKNKKLPGKPMRSKGTTLSRACTNPPADWACARWTGSGEKTTICLQLLLHNLQPVCKGISHVYTPFWNNLAILDQCQVDSVSFIFQACWKGGKWGYMWVELEWDWVVLTEGEAWLEWRSVNASSSLHSFLIYDHGPSFSSRIRSFLRR